jgi:hypothetical protein
MKDMKDCRKSDKFVVPAKFLNVNFQGKFGKFSICLRRNGGHRKILEDLRKGKARMAQNKKNKSKILSNINSEVSLPLLRLRIVRLEDSIF